MWLILVVLLVAGVKRGGGEEEDLQRVMWALLWVWVRDWRGNLQQAGRYAAARQIIFMFEAYIAIIGFGHQIRFQFPVDVQSCFSIQLSWIIWGQRVFLLIASQKVRVNVWMPRSKFHIDVKKRASCNMLMLFYDYRPNCVANLRSFCVVGSCALFFVHLTWVEWYASTLLPLLVCFRDMICWYLDYRRFIIWLLWKHYDWHTCFLNVP